MTHNPEPRTAFEWPIYADATLAGLAVLIPFPLVDWLVEERFRRRMPAAIARYRGRSLPVPVLQALNGPQRGCIATTFLLLIQAPLKILKRLSQKVVYVLTIKAATDKLSDYWQRAFLLDYMLAAGHLATVESARRARQAMERVLQTTPSPLTRLAQLVVASTRRVFQTVRRAWRAPSGSGLPEQQTTMRQQWSEYETFLRELAACYDQAYQARLGEERSRIREKRSER